MIYGGLIHAPLVFNWLRLAARLFPKDTTAHLLAKVAMDQSCFAPVGLSSFYIGLSALEGKDLDGIYKEWRDKMPNTWAVSQILWWWQHMHAVAWSHFSYFANFRWVQYAGHSYKLSTLNSSPPSSGLFLWQFSAFSGPQDYQLWNTTPVITVTWMCWNTLEIKPD